MDYIPAKILSKQASVYSPTSDAMSGYALAIRHDKLDYSMTKGGLRLWIVVLVFILLISGLVTLFSNKEITDLEGESGEDATEDSEIDEMLMHEKELMDKRMEEYRAKKKRKEAEKLAAAHEGEADDEEHDYVGDHEDYESDEEEERKDESREFEPEPEHQHKPKAPIKPVQKKRTKETSKEEELRLKRLSELAEAKRRAQEEEEGAENSKDIEQEEEKDEETVEEKEEKKEVETVEENVEGIIEETEEASVEKPLKSKEQRQPKKEKHIIIEEVEVKKVKEPKEIKPVKVFRTKGKAKEEVAAQHETTKPVEIVAEDEIEEETEQEVEDVEIKEVQKVSKKPPKPPIAVKTFRTKGKTAEELEEEASIRRALIGETHTEPTDEEEELEEVHEEEELFLAEICEKGAKCHEEETQETTSSKKPKKAHIAIKYIRKKGKSPEDRIVSERHVIEEQDEPIEQEKPRKPVIPISVFRTKGGTPKKAAIAEQQEQQQSLELDDHNTVIEKVAKRRQPTAPSYRKHAVTNKEDNKIRSRLDQADRLLDEREPEEALELFDQILKTYPSSPRAQYGRARALDLMAELKQSNSLLEESIRNYLLILELANVPEELYVLAANRYIDRAKFRGWVKKALDVQRKLVDKFPDDMKVLNDFGVMFLIMGRSDDAKKVFETVLAREPGNGFALTHYGFILKTADNKLEDAVDYLLKGINSGEEGTQDGRFFFQLGDALQRLNRTDEAYEIYEKGAEKGVFLSKLQRSLYNVERLTARPWWTPEQTTYVNQLKRIESEWRTIKDEGVALLDQKNIIFKKEDEKLTKEGDWRQFTLYARGKKNDENCARAPKTCALVEKFPEAVGCTRGQIKFSVMEGGTRVWPHCGPTNCRLRGHLGLIVPPDPRIRVGNETRAWKRGKFIIFDDSFEHEVWYEGSGFRLVLIVDFWHPELTPQQRASLTPI